MIDFLKYRYVALAFSCLIFASFIGMYIYRVSTQGSAFSYSVDFTGGTQVLFSFSKPTTEPELKSILEKNGWSSPIMRVFGPQEILVRVKEVATDVKGLAESMQTVLQSNLNDNTVTILATDAVGAGIGAALRWQSAKAIVIALLLMLVYIWFRFWSVSYGLGAVVSLFHDAIVILLCFMIFNKEISISVIAAILAILGYSVNDTIVIFARIRQNIKTMRNVPLQQIINLSINETLRRTVLCSLATLLVVISLVVLGGETLRDLALALLIGIVFGTYSSIYMASPVMMAFYKEAK